MRVNLVSAGVTSLDGTAGGIDRYCRQLLQLAGPQVEYVPCQVTAGPLSSFPLLRNLPLSIHGLDHEAPLHFGQIIGVGVAHVRRLPPRVATVHDLGLLEWPPEREMFSAAARIILALSRSALKRMDRLIADSISTAAALERHLAIPGERITHVPLGVDHTVFYRRPEARERLDRDYGLGEWKQWRTIVFVGSELPRKNLRLLLEVVAACKGRGRRLRLIKAGSAGGPRWRAATVRAISELDLRERVMLLDGLDDDGLAHLYSAADAVVCASHVEGFSLPTLEAMACAAPTVVSASGALAELVGDTGLVVARGVAEAWIDTLERLWTEPGLSGRLGAAASTRAEQFTWERTANATHAIYEELGRGIR